MIINIYEELNVWLDNKESGKPTSEISSWDVSNVKVMSRLFSPERDSRLKDFNEDISSWNVGNVTDMTAMFKGCHNFNRDLSGWNVENVKYAALMFQNASSFNSDLNNWQVDNMENMYSMFENATNFNSKNIDNWNIKTDAITDKKLKNANIKGVIDCEPNTGVKFNKYVNKVESPDISGIDFIFPVGENITHLIPEVKVCYSDVSFNINTNVISNIPKSRLVDLSVNNVISTLDISLNFINRPIITGIKKSTTELSDSVASEIDNNIEIQNNFQIYIGFDVSSSIVPYKYKLKSGGVEISNIDIPGITFDESSGILSGIPDISDEIKEKDVSFSVIAVVDGKDAPDIVGLESSLFNIKVQKKPEISNYTYNNVTYASNDLIRLQKDSSHNLTVNMATNVVVSHYTIEPDIVNTGLVFNTSTGNISGFVDTRLINKSYTIKAFSEQNIESDSFKLRISIKDIRSQDEAIASYDTMKNNLTLLEQLKIDISDIKKIVDSSMNDISNTYQEIIDISDVLQNPTAYQKVLDISDNISFIKSFDEQITKIDVSLNDARNIIIDEWEDIRDISNIPSVDALTFVVGGIDASYNKLKETTNQIYTTINDIFSGISEQKIKANQKYNNSLTHANELKNDLDSWKISISDISNNVNNIDISYNNFNTQYINTDIENEIQDISQATNIINTSNIKADIISNITNSINSLNIFKNKYENISQINTILQEKLTDLSENKKTNLLNTLNNSSVSSSGKTLYRNSQNLSQYTDLQSIISNLSVVIATSKNNISNELTKYLHEYDNLDERTDYLYSLNTWLGDEYTFILQEATTIDDSYNDLSNNYIDKKNNLHNSLQNLDSCIVDISNSNNKEDIINKVEDGSNNVNTFKENYNNILSINTTLQNKLKDLFENETKLINKNKFNELEIYKELNNKNSNVIGKLNILKNTVEIKLNEQKENFETNVNETFNYINSVNEIPNLSYFRIAEYVDTDINNNPISTPIKLQKPFTEFEIIGVNLLPPDLSLNINSGLIYGQVREEVTDLSVNIKGTNIMGLSRNFIIEIDIAVELGGADITELLDKFTTEDGGETTIELGVREGLTDAIGDINSSLTSPSGEKLTEEKEAEVIDKFFNASISAIETNTKELKTEQKTGIFSSLVRNIFNIKKDNKKIKIKPKVLKDFGIPIKNTEKPVAAIPINTPSDVTPEDTNYSPLNTLEFIRYNYRHPDIQFQLYIKRKNDDDYILEIKYLDSIDTNDRTIQIIDTPGKINGTTVVHKILRGAKEITLTLHFGSACIEIDIDDAVIGVDCCSFRKEKLSSSHALSNKKAMTVSKIVGEGANVKCLTKIGGPGDLWSSKQKSKYGLDKKHGSYERYLNRKIGNVLRKQTLARKDPLTEKTTYMLTDRTKFVTSRIPNCKGCGNDETKCTSCRGCLNIK